MMKILKILILSIMFAYWAPQPGPQTEAATCPVDFTFFGGSRGGGKSDCLIGRQIRGAELYGVKWNGLVIRRQYKDFAELRRRIDELIASGLPAERSGGDLQTNIVRINGGHFFLTAVQRLEKVNDFVGHQYTEISFDECTTFPFFTRMIDKLKGSNRSPHGVPCHMFGTGNPGGSGHLQVKEYFQLGTGGVKPRTIIKETLKGTDGQEFEETRIFIPSFLRDNHILYKNDPKYVARLLSIKDPLLKKAWIDGDWDVFIGQAFGFSDRTHVIRAIEIPAGAPLYMTFDWGSSKPFSIGWWWVDADGRLYRFAEWYGWNGTQDEGLRLEDSKIAEGIKEREQAFGIATRQIARVCDPTCFNKKPDYTGKGQGPSTAEVFAAHGLYLTPGDPSRELKIRQFRERLAVLEDGTMPMLMVYDVCTHFRRTIPALAMDEMRPEDVDTEQEDHCFAGDTIIQTNLGDAEIKSLVGTAGKILAPGGFWADYNNCRLTRENLETVGVRFNDGSLVKCTPDHEFMTLSGWKKAVDLIDEQCYVSNPNKALGEETCASILSATQFRNSTENGITNAVYISREKGEDSIGLYGNFIMEQFQKAIMFITKQVIGLKTKLKILNLELSRTICRGTQRPPTMILGLNLCTTGPKSGMEAPKDWSGTESSLKKIAGKPWQKEKKNNVKFARLFFKVRRGLGSVRGNVKCPGGIKTVEDFKNDHAFSADKFSRLYGQQLSNAVQWLAQQNSDGKTLKAVGVQPLGKSDVYCLSVPSVHSFTLKNGVVVSNCYDEACLVVMARPLAMTVPVKKESFTAQRIDALKAGTEYTEEAVHAAEALQQEHAIYHQIIDEAYDEEDWDGLGENTV